MSSNKVLRLAPMARSGLWCRKPNCALTGQQSYRHYWPSRRTYLCKGSEPWDRITDMERSMNRLWRDFERMSPFGALRHRLFEPDYGFRTAPIETTDDGKRLYKIALDLGNDFRPEDINVTAKDRVVTVKARRESDADGCKQSHEYSYEYSLPEEVNVEQIRSLLTSEGQLVIEAPLPELKEPSVTKIPVQKADK